MPRALITFAAVGAMTLAACTSTADIAGPTQGSAATAVTSTTTSTTTSATTTVPSVDSTATTLTSAAPPAASTTAVVTAGTTGAISQDDLVRFIAATETVLKGTPNEGVVYDAPEIYIAIAQAACVRFTAGDTLQQVADDLLTQLASANPTDDKRLVGAILGAATRTICPENAGVV